MMRTLMMATLMIYDFDDDDLMIYDFDYRRP